MAGSTANRALFGAQRGCEPPQAACRFRGSDILLRRIRESLVVILLMMERDAKMDRVMSVS